MTKAEAGRLGGKATLARHGTAFFKAIGARQPPEARREAGRKAGQSYVRGYLADPRYGQLTTIISDDQIPY